MKESSIALDYCRAASVQPPEGAPRPPLGDHNADRLVEDHAGHETGFDPMPERGLKATIGMLVECPEQRADHVPQQLAFGGEIAPHKSCPFTWVERTYPCKVALTNENKKWGREAIADKLFDTRRGKMAPAYAMLPDCIGKVFQRFRS